MTGFRLELDANGAVFHLSGQDAIVGRDPACDIVVDVGTVSSRHGLFRVEDGAYTYTDLGSRNGSALQRGLETRSIGRGQAVALEQDDALILGSAEAPATFRLRPAPLLAPARPTRTIIAQHPLADLFAAPANDLAAVAAHILSADTAERLAEAALEAVQAAFPAAVESGAEIEMAGARAVVGARIPEGLRSIAADSVVLLTTDDLPTTRSLVAGGVRTAVVVPVVAHGVGHGTLAAWFDTIVAPNAALLHHLGLVASLVALQAAALSSSLAARRREAERPTDPDAPIGQSPAFVAVLELARTVATANVPLLILGETGSGKEVLARAVHRWSPRAARTFVAFNCAAVPENLLESELFGHVRGAFTGAERDKPGLFELADGGTLFLDEIGEMALAMQAKLLRTLQDGEIRRVGGTRSTQVDVRVLSATHRDVPTLVAQGKFRQDLYYRINTVTVRIPPLRDRGDDIPTLAHVLLGRVAERQKKSIPGFTRAALQSLRRHSFPGNIRELENELVRAVALTRDGHPIDAAVFSEALLQGSPESRQGADDGEHAYGTFREVVERAERRAVEAALERASGNVSQAARDLELTRPGLYKVMERLGMRSPGGG